MEILIIGLDILRRVLARFGPYLFIELLLPGGTLLALALYLYRRRKSLTEALLARTSTPALARGPGSTV